MMGVLLTDDREDQTMPPIVIGKIEFLPTSGFVPPRTDVTNVRSIARDAIESRLAQRSEKQIAEAAARPLQFPKPTLLTELPCSQCFNDSRFAKSALCLRCINVKAAAEQRALPHLFDHELTVREYLGLCALVGLLLFCVCWFDAQPNGAISQAAAAGVLK